VANRLILIEHTGIRQEDIIQERWSSTDTFSPGHYIAVDHSTESLVVAIRGTFHIRDVLTDLVAAYIPFKGGLTHSGILAAAQEKFKDLTPLLLRTLKTLPNYRLVIVGHSLGAGTAALLAILLHDEYSLDLHCYAFAPPCLLSLDLAAKCKDFITTIILNDDLVPRLCFGSIEDLKKIIQHLISAEGGTTMQRMFQILSVGNSLGQGLTKKLSGYLECNPVPDLGVKKLVPSERLHPPGKIIYVYSDSIEKKKKESRYDLMEESAPSLFFDIVLSNCMITDHMPDLYETSIKNCLDRLQTEVDKEQKKSDLDVGSRVFEKMEK